MGARGAGLPSLRDAESAEGSRASPTAGRQEDWRELNHRVANSLQLAASFLEYQRRRIADPLAREALSEAGARLDAVGRLHRFLYSGDGAARVNLRDFLGELCPGIAASTGLRVVAEVDPVEAPFDMAQHLGIAVNELATNAGKHAFAEGEAGEIHIRLTTVGGFLVLTVADGGKGFPDGFDPFRAPGLGMRVVLSVAHQFGGDLEVHNEGGATFVLRLPLPPPPEDRRP